MTRRHHTARGYRNNYPHEHHDLWSFFRFLWKFQRQPWQRPKLPVAASDPQRLRANRTEPTLTWVGHSTFLVQIAGLNVLTDPHFTRRASPLNWAGPDRLTPVGLKLSELPPLDLVLISHNHYDHLDDRTVRWLARHHARALFVVPLGLHRWMRKRGVKHCVELDWWQSTDGELEKNFRVSAVPAQHFSGRTATDRNKTLWCGFILEAGGRKVYFAGDTGYSKDFADIGARYAPVDLALIPIGAYEPRWFMRAMHVNPDEAARIHRDIGSKLSVAMHWGTFRLTEEPLEEPPQRLAAALESLKIPPAEFRVMRHGETLHLPF